MRDALSDGSARSIPRLYRDFLVMREMGWSWQELMAAPLHVVETIWAFMQEEAAHRAAQGRDEGLAWPGGLPPQ